jgi:hypothetical protein
MRRTPRNGVLHAEGFVELPPLPDKAFPGASASSVAEGAIDGTARLINPRAHEGGDPAISRGRPLFILNIHQSSILCGALGSKQASIVEGVQGVRVFEDVVPPEECQRPGCAISDGYTNGRLGICLLIDLLNIMRRKTQ